LLDIAICIVLWANMRFLVCFVDFNSLKDILNRLTVFIFWNELFTCNCCSCSCWTRFLLFLLLLLIFINGCFWIVWKGNLGGIIILSLELKFVELFAVSQCIFKFLEFMRVVHGGFHFLRLLCLNWNNQIIKR